MDGRQESQSMLPSMTARSISDDEANVELQSPLGRDAAHGACRLMLNTVTACGPVSNQ